MSSSSRAWGCIRYVSALSLLLGCGGPAATQDETSSSEQAPFSTSPQEPNHERITAEALAFLRPELLAALVFANVSTDVEFVLVNANHFDDCNFSGGSQVVSSNQSQAVAHLDPALTSPEDEASAIVHFARSLHAVQDFYAHTNWVESGGSVLVDNSLEAFPDLTGYQTIPSTGFVVVQGRKPKRSALTRDDDAAYPANAIVTFKSGHDTARGLISGTVDYEPGDDCPASVAMTHSELNKDKSTLVGRESQYAAARGLAVAQSRHEWCRLRALVHQSWGQPGDLQLSSWVDAAASEPDCATE
jgi:hypothetical protein